MAWQRKGLWSIYPDDHIGRLKGEACAFLKNGEDRDSPLNDLGLELSRPWANDPHSLGTNDFRSTKENIFWASLGNKNGPALLVISDGTQHVRAWADEQGIRMLVAFYNNPGAERFFRGHAGREDRPLAPGSVIQDRIRLKIVGIPPPG
ncbi:MAG: hypothetical protein ABIK28_23610 [Planctomycetota bacterium]